MTSTIYFRFEYRLDTEKLHFDGLYLCALEVKRLIALKVGLLTSRDVDLVLKCEHNGQEYVDEQARIPKDSSVLVRKINVRRPLRELAAIPAHPTARAFQPAGISLRQRFDPAVSLLGQCRRCQAAGHWARDCPTQNDPSFDRIPLAFGVPSARTRPLSPTEVAAVMTGADRAGVARRLDGQLVRIAADEDTFYRHLARGAPFQCGPRLAIQEPGSVPPELRCTLSGAAAADAALMPCCMAAVSRAAAAARLAGGGGCPLCMDPDAAADRLLPYPALSAAVHDYLQRLKAEPAAPSLSTPSPAANGAPSPRCGSKRRRL